MKYAAIIVLGTQPDTSTWQFPQQIYDCLDRAKDLLEDGQAPCIITSGKWSISIDKGNLVQPFRECDRLAEYLIKKGVSADKILREGESKDTLSNLYYLKTRFFIPQNMQHLVFVVAGFRIPRLAFLCERILGPDYTVDFESVPAEMDPSDYESNTFNVQKDFLKPMKSGDHFWLDDKFYTASLYKHWAKADEARTAVVD